ncbi:type II toxin-antitoxin system VapC family toxin [Sphingomonas sp. PAMC 26617]|uniref:type II toxin-antitoxin system VapC family toxin n=1 Tax=Sphingomonas sp. PAMC 26617 TaxID=1112216 RepID=UPI000287F145|nr:type II toxin-antitoxin system VapC family toxin [Sphingomonas sp. PAMC 26617]
MILFLDASAMVAMLTGEPGSPEIEERFGAADEIVCSAVSLWETSRAVAKIRTVPIPLAFAEIETFVADFAIRLVPIGATESRAAVDAYHRYGKGTGHPARLNMGDCFAYACAKTNAATLLYKGDDFLHTDLA